jgi:uncharacterized protein YdaU (DUF1376 family)
MKHQMKQRPPGTPPLVSYPWYVADWRNSETRARLTLAERGLFRELIDQCAMEGSIPDDARMLARICGCSLKDINRLLRNLRDQFVQDGDRLINPKAAEVRQRVIGFHEARKTAGTAGARKRWAKAEQLPVSSPGAFDELPVTGSSLEQEEDAAMPKSPIDSTTATSSAMAKPKLGDSLPQPQPLPQPRKNINAWSPDGERPLDLFPVDSPRCDTLDGEPAQAPRQHPSNNGWGPKEKASAFAEGFWPLWPRKVAKAAAEKAWQKYAVSPKLADTIVSAVRAQLPQLTADLKYCPYPATWLNQRRFDDDPAEYHNLPTAANTSDPRSSYQEWNPNWKESAS